MHKHHNQNTTLHREYLHGKNIDHYLFSKEDEKNHHIFNVGRRLGQDHNQTSLYCVFFLQLREWYLIVMLEPEKSPFSVSSWI